MAVESAGLAYCGSEKPPTAPTSIIEKVKIRKHRGQIEFEALVQDVTLDTEQKEVLQYAEWERTTVYLNINAKILDDAIKHAVIIGVERRDPPELIKPQGEA